MRPLNALLPSLLTWLILGACVHKPATSGLEGLKPVVEDFHQQVRWKNFGAAARMWVPEQREAFEKARRKEEKDLQITDYEIQSAELEADGQSARVVSRMQWLKLPSASEQSEQVTSHFVFRQGAWLLERQEGGPFAEEEEEDADPDAEQNP